MNSSMATALSLANYSVLGPKAKAPVHMTTERRGITIRQIQQLLDFVSFMVQFWTGTYGGPYVPRNKEDVSRNKEDVSRNTVVI